MAIDEALLQTTSRSLLRFYRWSQASVSFGYFGSFDEARAFAGGCDLVRRWTGGGMVLHGEDLTYSLIISAHDAAYTISSRRVYRCVHEAIARSLQSSGLQSTLADIDAPKITDSCFATPVIADVMVGGRKIAGSAQRRTRNGLLHQGSIQRNELEQRFRINLAGELSNNIFREEISSGVLATAQKLAAGKYATETWLRRR